MIAKSLVAAAFATSTSRRCRLAARPHVCRRISNTGILPKEHVMFMTISDTTLSDPSLAETTNSAALSPPGITPIQEFEPVLNMEAAASFVIIAIVFTLLQLRINAVSNASKRRSLALEALRKAESLQLSASDVGIEEQVTLAKEEYENALIDEMELRTIIPGVRIVAPNDPKRDEEERAAAKRFLGWGSEEFGDDPNDTDIGSNSLGLEVQESNRGRDAQQNESDSGLSNSAKIILFGVASILIVLLWTLSFDPMMADQIMFTTVGGSPPSNMPLSSW